jgi:hypothetical protein
MGTLGRQRNKESRGEFMYMNVDTHQGKRRARNSRSEARKEKND